jgi:hypothetical protein
VGVALANGVPVWESGRNRHDNETSIIRIRAEPFRHLFMTDLLQI